MNLNQVAAQLYTIRDYLKTPSEIAVSLKKISQIGYRAVQCSGLGPIAEDELFKLCAGEGLVICATHESSEAILKEPQRIAKRLESLGTKITAYPYPGGVNFDTLEAVKDFCRKLNASGKVLHEAGLILCYHNHQIEFRRLAGRSILEIIYAETDSRYLQGEPDTYWIQNGGGDVVEWCNKLKGRLPIIHLKDCTVLSNGQVSVAEIGNGNLNWKRIVAAAEQAGCQWYAVEQDSCPGDPFESLKQSFEYLRDNLCSK